MPTPREDCVEWKDIPAVFIRRTAYAKIHMLLAPNTTSNEYGVDPELGPSIREQWVACRDPEEHEKGFTIPALCYLADTFRPLPELYGVTGNWFPTLSMGVEVKKSPPEGQLGWKWLFMRIEAHQIRNGRIDLDVAILDEDGDLVALSRHAALIVSSERNYKRGGSGNGKDAATFEAKESKM